ncbi:MAG: transcriptional regulator with XRE-family HTH domain [Cognaticolwellia sp.]|jgi:transcriptional regulator with XRE-family HTH domain
MQAISSQVIRALRGRRSQLAFSRRLKYRSNVVADWEQGRRFPTAGEFLRAAQMVGVDLSGAFIRFHAASAPAIGTADDAGVARWLDELRGQSSLQDLAARSGVSRHALGRWLSGRTRPRLPDFLHLVDVLTGRVQDLIAELVDVREVPALAERVDRAAASRKVGLEEPWALPVLLAIETRGYLALEEHDGGWLARFLGLPEARVRSCVTRLEKAGVIHLKGGHYVSGQPLTIDTRAHPEAGRSLKRHWLMVGMDRVGQPREGDILSYNLFSVSRADLGQIRLLQRSFFREVRGIVAASEPSESVALLNLQLVTWEE